MSNYVNCFSNANESMHWQFNNCDQCKTKSGCFAKRNIELGFITGHITNKAAYYIGISSYMVVGRSGEHASCTLADKCEKFNVKRKVKKVKRQNPLEQTLF
jgi:hypothetical protein